MCHRSACIIVTPAGASAIQRQLMLAVSKQRQAPESAQPDSSHRQSATIPAEAWARMQALLGYSKVLQEAAEAAHAACAAAAANSSSRLQELAQAVDNTALCWLTTTLQQLPRGMAVCSISTAVDYRPDSHSGVLITRVVLAAADSVARVLVMQLPAPRSNSIRQVPLLLSECHGVFCRMLVVCNRGSSTHRTAYGACVGP